MKKDLILIINGAGTNGSELKALYKKLSEDERYFVYYPGIMPGSFVGTYFPKSTTKDFIQFIDSTLELVNEDAFENVYLIGYSLGASTCSIIAATCPKITKMILIAPIVNNPNYRKFIKGLGFSLAYSKNLTRVQRIFFSEFVKRFLRVPKIHVLHLELYFHYTRRYLRQIDKPTLIIETLKDEMVKKKSIDKLERNIKNDVKRIPVDSSHFLFFDRNVRDEVIEHVKAYIEEDAK
jgi:esterase/lipase